MLLFWSIKHRANVSHFQFPRVFIPVFEANRGPKRRRTECFCIQIIDREATIMNFLTVRQEKRYQGSHMLEYYNLYDKINEQLGIPYGCTQFNIIQGSLYGTRQL